MPEKTSVLELEQAIDNSLFFTVSGEEMEAIHNTAKAKLVLDLFKLSQYYWKNPEYFAVILETIYRCMEQFDPEMGKFSNYFKNQARYAILNSNKKEWKVNKHETGFSATKQFDHDNVEEMIEKQGALSQMSDYLEIIEKAFRKKQERTQPWLRTLWTHKCFDALVSIDLPDKHYTWIDYEFLEKYSNTESLPAQKEVAAMFGRCEQDASRAIRQFCELVAPRFLTASQK